MKNKIRIKSSVRRTSSNSIRVRTTVHANGKTKTKSKNIRLK